ncbi:MAG: TIM barrel protein [Eubacteriales bacterium]|nr:TIM barrel protein [Eubacteriales bacterium]
MAIRFGPSGNSASFYEQGNKKSVQAPGWIAARGLNAYEYSFGKGITITEPTARAIGEAAKAHDVEISVHAPYYINLANPDAEKRSGGIEYLRRSAQALRWFGGTRIVFHPGSCAKLPRAQAMEFVLAMLKEAAASFFAEYPDVFLCPETMGKLNQVGTPAEVAQMCAVHDNYLPTVDFGHVNAREQGVLKTKADYAAVLDTLENEIGSDRVKRMHIHFSRIEYTAAGEKRHLTFADKQYGPFFEPLAELIVQRNMEPVIICESDGTMAEDALEMQRIYLGILEQKGEKI